ncbi:MAG: GDP-mannose 4,6-dehydratase, partial [Candidatus Sericytochromatia bacterium]|nr:GDP-mannose 4,6-dehydratase [Candidatus Sericytochromatia bacterium]
MNTKKALIIGVSGQDGSYLSNFLLEKGYQVYGTTRNPESTFTGLETLAIKKYVEILKLLPNEMDNVESIINTVKPDEIYNLSGQGSVGLSFEQPLETFISMTLGNLNILECIRKSSFKTKFFNASSGEIFGNNNQSIVNENTNINPKNPYAVAKASSHLMVSSYRESYDMFACNGILFNHESPLRTETFVARKITASVARIKLGLQDKLSLGRLDIIRDWGFAGDYVEAMWVMLQQDKPQDFIISTSIPHSVKEFVQKAFNYADINLKWIGTALDEKAIDSDTGKIIVEIEPKFLRKLESNFNVGDNSKIIKDLAWFPKKSLNDIIK